MEGVTRSNPVLHNANGTSGAGPFVISIAWRQSCQEHVQLPQTADIRRFWAVPYSRVSARIGAQNHWKISETRACVDRRINLRVSASVKLISSDTCFSLDVGGINKVPDTRERAKLGNWHRQKHMDVFRFAAMHRIISSPPELQ